LKNEQEVCVPVGITENGKTVYYILNPMSRSLDCLVDGQKVGFNGYVSKEPNIKQYVDTKLQKLIWHIDDVENWADMFYKRRMNIAPELMTGSSTILVKDLITNAEGKTDNLDMDRMSRRDARRLGKTKPSKKIGFEKL
jgi:hypothetical protein